MKKYWEKIKLPRVIHTCCGYTYDSINNNAENYFKCFEIIDSLDKEYWDKYKILLYDNNNFNKMSYVSLQTLATLISQPDIMNSDFEFYL